MFQTTKQMVMMFLAIVSYEMVVSTHPKLVKWVGQIYCHGKLGDFPGRVPASNGHGNTRRPASLHTNVARS